MQSPFTSDHLPPLLFSGTLRAWRLSHLYRYLYRIKYQYHSLSVRNSLLPPITYLHFCFLELCVLGVCLPYIDICIASNTGTIPYLYVIHFYFRSLTSTFVFRNSACLAFASPILIFISHQIPVPFLTCM